MNGRDFDPADVNFNVIARRAPSQPGGGCRGPVGLPAGMEGCAACGSTGRASGRHQRMKFGLGGIQVSRGPFSFFDGHGRASRLNKLFLPRMRNVACIFRWGAESQSRMGSDCNDLAVEEWCRDAALCCGPILMS